MADENDDEQRRALEEFQRQQAEKARQSSQGQPNAIPNEQPQPNRGVDYAQRGLIPTIEPNAQGGFDVPQGVAGVAVQGSPLSDQETQFWQANPLGAVKDPVTGNLIGLGDTPARQQQVTEAFPQRQISVNSGLGPPFNYNQVNRVNAGLGPPAVQPQFSQQQRDIPNFVNIPEVDPNIGARRSQIAQSIADIDRRLPSASTNRVARGQPSERERLIMERAHYVRADDVLANEMHNQNQARTHASDLNLKLRNQYATTSDATALREEFAKIKSKPGTPQYAQDVLNLRINHPDAMNDPRSVELLDRAARQHEEEAAFLQRAQSQGIVPQVSGFHQGHTTYTVPKSPDTDKQLAAYGVKRLNITNPVAVQLVRIEGDKAIPDSNGNVVAIDTGKSGGKMARVPVEVYLANGGKLSPQDMAAQQAKQAQPTATPTGTPTEAQRLLAPDIARNVTQGAVLDKANASLQSMQNQQLQKDRAAGIPNQPARATVIMRSPNGTTKDVPVDLIDYYRRKGAEVVEIPQQ